MHMHKRTSKYSRTYTCTHLSLSLLLSHTHIHSCPHTHIHTHTHNPPHKHTHTHTHSYTHIKALFRTQTLGIQVGDYFYVLHKLIIISTMGLKGPFPQTLPSFPSIPLHPFIPPSLFLSLSPLHPPHHLSSPKITPSLGPPLLSLPRPYGVLRGT